MSYVDRNQVWVRRNDTATWYSFWSVVQFIRALTADQSHRGRPFAGVFTESIGAGEEMAIPGEHRAVFWFSEDATPDCIGGINWHNSQFFAESPEGYIPPFLPPRRTSAHINEIEFSVEIMRTVFRSDNNPSLIMCGITDNACSNSWARKGGYRRGSV